MVDGLETSRWRRIGVWRLAGAAVLALAVILAACGGGGGGSGSGDPDNGPVLPPMPGAGTALVLAGSPDDPVTRGKAFSYTQANALVRVTAEGSLFQVEILGDERWVLRFSAGVPVTSLAAGTYRDLREVHQAQGGSSFNLEAPRTPAAPCTTRSSNVVVDRVSFAGGTLTELSLSFEHRCPGPTATIRGRLRWLASDTTRGPGPAEVPTGLWQPPADATPAAGNYVYLESASGDPVGGGQTWLHTAADTWIRAEPAGPRIKIAVRGDSNGSGTFYAMDSLARLQTGYYAGLMSELWRNPRRGAVVWTTDIDSCEGRTRGWMAIDAVSYQGDALSAIEFRFEQRCADGNAPPLRGKIRWSAADTPSTDGPPPVPAGLWDAPAGALPASGSYVYLQSEGGEWIGQGQTLLITPNQAAFVLYQRDGRLSVSLGRLPIREWIGSFQGKHALRRLERGHYARLLDAVARNPVRGGINWSGQARGCDARGWFTVDGVSYTRGVLRSIDLRFEQTCKGNDKALRGKIHWVTDDPVLLADGVVDDPLPPAPPPSTEPPADGRNHVLLDSGADDPVGAWGRYLYTQADARLSVALAPASLQMSVAAGERWFAEFSAYSGNPATPNAPPLAPGTYIVGERLDQPGPRMRVSSDQGIGCSSVHGSFTVERVSLAGTTVQALDLSFEQYCGDAYLPLRGRIHWVADDPVQPSGPVLPVPTSLWRAPEALVPADTNHLFVHAPAGEFIRGEGFSRLFKAPEVAFTVRARPQEAVYISVEQPDGVPTWLLDFQPPYNVSRLAPGLYPSATRSAVGNPAFGRMGAYGGERSCSELDGWFAVDAVAYDGNELSALDLRFEQYCKDGGPPLRGQLRWRR